VLRKLYHYASIEFLTQSKFITSDGGVMYVSAASWATGLKYVIRSMLEVVP
jgi:hypothetical protein